MLHITNGDAAAEPLRSFVDGRVVLACDPLHEGPAPAVDDDRWFALRAKHLARRSIVGTDVLSGDLAAADASIAAATDEERVLWFEHDLFDQLNLIRTLAVIERTQPDAASLGSVFLICIDRFDGVDPFYGLSQLSAAQLQSLWPRRRVVTPDQFALASEAWSAFRQADPTALVSLTAALRTGASPLPFLGAALERLLEEYPWTGHGLSRTEHQALCALTDGPSVGRSLFRRSQAAEDRPFMGDSTLFDLIEDLARARVPLVTIEGGLRTPDVNVGEGLVALTDAGRDVVRGRADAVRLNGIDRWRGGVHLAGAESPWRWNPAQRTLTRLL